MKKAIFLILVLATFYSCKKAGTGGDATIVAYPQHHKKPIKGARVYLKFNTKNFPGSNTADYDTYFTAMANEDHVKCEGLKAGKNYLYSVGYDSSYSQTVTGGVPVKIKFSERSKEIDVYIPVTE